MLRPVADCNRFVEFREILGKPAVWAKADSLWGTTAERVCELSREGSQEITRMAPVWWRISFGTCMCLQRRNNGACQQFSTKRAAPPAVILKPGISLPLHMSLALLKLLPYYWSSDRVSSSATPSTSPLRGMPGSLSYPDRILADFHSQLWGILFLALGV